MFKIEIVQKFKKDANRYCKNVWKITKKKNVQIKWENVTDLRKIVKIRMLIMK